MVKTTHISGLTRNGLPIQGTIFNIVRTVMIVNGLTHEYTLLGSSVTREAVQVGGGALISMAGNATSQIMQNNGFENFDVGDMLIDGAIGGLARLAGGKGAGSKHLNSLGKQAARRTAKELVRNVSAAGRELSKATSYYVKNAKHVVKPLLKSLRGSGVVSFFGSLVKSKYALRR